MRVEEWRPIPGFPGYQVSNLGNIKGKYDKGRPLRIQTNRIGYCYIKAYRDSKPIFLHVHRAVCEAFHGAPPFEGAEVMHKDDIKSNNAADNLQWGAHWQNIEQREERRKCA